MYLMHYWKDIPVNFHVSQLAGRLAGWLVCYNLAKKSNDHIRTPILTGLVITEFIFIFNSWLVIKKNDPNDILQRFFAKYLEFVMHKKMISGKTPLLKFVGTSLWLDLNKYYS